MKKPTAPSTLTEAAIYKVTPTRIFAYKKRSTDPSKIQTVQIRHGEVWKHYKDLVNPPPEYKVIGHIGPNYGHPDDIELVDPSKPIVVDDDSEAVKTKGGDKKFVEPGATIHGKGKKTAKEPEPTKDPEPEAQPEPAKEPEKASEPQPEPEAQPEPEEASDEEINAAFMDAVNKVYDGAEVTKLGFIKLVNKALGPKATLGKVVATYKDWEEKGILSTDDGDKVVVKTQKEPEPPAEEPSAQEPAPEEPAPEPKKASKPSIVDQDVWDLVKDEEDPFFPAVVLQKLKITKGGVPTNEIYKGLADAGLKSHEQVGVLDVLANKNLIHQSPDLKTLFFGQEPEDKSAEQPPEEPEAEPTPEPEPEPKKEPEVPSDALRFFLSNWGSNAAKAWNLDVEQKKMLAKFMHQAMDTHYGPGTSDKVVALFKNLKSQMTPEDLNALKTSNHEVMNSKHGNSWVVLHPLAKLALDAFNTWKKQSETQTAKEEPPVPTPAEPQADAPAVSPETDTTEPPKEVDVTAAPKPVAAPLTANSPSKITAFAKSETGMFHPEDFAILDNKLVLRKYFTQLKNKYYADKKEKEVHAYMTDKYGPGWKEEYENLQGTLKSSLSKHAYYKKSQQGYQQLVDAYGDDWIHTHPTLAAVWAGQKPDSPPVLVNQPTTDVAPKPLTPEEVFAKIDTSKASFDPFSKDDFISYALVWTPAFSAMEKEEGYEAAEQFFGGVGKFLKSKYAVDHTGGLSDAHYDWKESIGEDVHDALQSDTIEALKKTLGDKWYREVPLFKEANAKPVTTAKPSPAQDGGLAAGTKSVITKFKPEELGSFHPEDYVIGQFTHNALTAWKKKHGEDVALKRLHALQTYFKSKYGDGWEHTRDQIHSHLYSKHGEKAMAMHLDALKELNDAYGDQIWEKHPSIVAALKDLPDTKPSAITAQDLLPGKPTAFKTFSQAEAKNFHPEDLFLLMNRHTVLSAWYEKMPSEEASSKFGTWMAYYKAKYGDLALKQANDIKSELSDDSAFMDRMAQAEAEMANMYGDNWQLEHPTVVAAFKGEAPPQALGTNAAPISKGSWKDFTPNGPTVVKAITPEMAVGWHPEELVLFANRHKLKDVYSDVTGDDIAADDWYSSVFDYYSAKYGDGFHSEGDELGYKAKATGHLASATEELVSHYGSSWKTLLQNHPVLQAIKAGVKPEPVNVPLKKADVTPKATPSGFDPYTAHKADIGKFSPEDFALLTHSTGLWHALKQKHGGKAGDHYQKVLYYLQAKYGPDAQTVAKTLQGTHTGDALSADAISTHLKDAYGQNWIDAHPTVVAAMSGKTPDTVVAPAPAAVTPADAQAQVASTAKKPTKKATASSISDPEPFKGAVPSGKDLKFHSDASHLGGAFQKSIYTDNDGKKWLFKPAITGSGKKKVYSAYGAQAFASIAQKIKPNHLPIAKTEIKGVEGTVQPLLETENGKLKTLAGVMPSELSPIEREDVAAEHILDWLFSQHDTHAKNLIRTADGHVLGIDKDQTFRFIETDKLSIDYHPNEGEGAPYYNHFWSSWSEGEFEFDPSSLGSYITKIEEVTPQEYEAAVLPYAQTLFPNNYEDQALFIQRAKNRKNGIRADFEKFITNLYKKKTKKEGKFTFEGGWDGPVDEKAPGPLAKKTKYSAEQLLASKNAGKIVEYKDKNGVSDPSKITLKMHTSPEDLASFLKDLNLTSLGPIKVGSHYNMAFLNKADWDKAYVEKIEKIEPAYGYSGPKFPPTPPKPKYLPQIEVHAKNIAPNAHELKTLEHSPIPYSGKAFHIGGAAVESQSVRVKKHINPKGKPYYRVMFKLLPKYVDMISGGSSTTHGIPMGTWDEQEGAFKDTSDNSFSMTTKSWQDGDSSIHLHTDKGNYAYMNMVFANVYPKKGESFAEAFERVLKTMNPNVAEAVTRDPTPEEQEVAKLARLLWSHAPQASDSLKPHEYTKASLIEKLKENGIKPELADKIQTVHTAPGYVSHVLPGYWKEAKNAKGEPYVRYVFHSASTPENIINQVKNGILGIVERLASGLPPKGSSLHQDINSGGADNIYTRIATQANENGGLAEGASVSGEYHMIIAPDELDRLDAYGHSDDMYGVCSPYWSNKGSVWKNRMPMHKLLQKIGKSHHGSNEINFRKGISPTRILRIATDDEGRRAKLIQAFKNGGMEEVNGVPVEDFIVVANTQKEVYDKYVKPLGF